MDNNLNTNRIISEYRKKFYNLYHKSIIPLFRKYEKERKSKLTILYVFIPVLILICIIVGYSFCSGNSTSVAIYFIDITAFIFSIVAMIWLPFHLNSSYVKELKSNCMPKILELFGNVHWYCNTHTIDDYELVNSDLFSAYNIRTTDDSFIGVYNGVKFKICETFMQYESGSGKNRRVVTIFDGVVIKFDSNKMVKNKTIIATRGDMYTRQTGKYVSICFTLTYFVFAIIQDLLKGNNILPTLVIYGIVMIVILLFSVLYKAVVPKEILREIKLEDPEFSKKYKAYSSDQVEGRYLITPAFMERFKNIQTSFGAKNVKCSFYDNSLMFAISTPKNLFEIGNLFYNLDDPRQLEVFFNEIISIFMLVDYFKLNEKSGL